VNASVPSLPAPGPVHRLTFEYDGDQVSLVSDQQVELIVPPTQPLERAESDSGFTVILRDADDKPLYRFTRSSPMRHDAEVFSESGDRTVERTGIDRPKGAFTVLVPDVTGAETVELFGHPLRPQAHLEKPRSLARFTLRAFEGA
jgi:hypothetical protein